MTQIKVRAWCTQCDIDMEKSGLAMDCPSDGNFYICPECHHRIVIFIEEKE